MQEYNPKEIEKKWQDKWEKEKLYLTLDSVEGKENEYVLVEFAYPSGNLHVGHWYAFSVPDMYARYRRMLGKNVLFPMGFDAFGLPAENAAIKNNLNPRDWTFSNIDYMRNQLHSMGASFDWSREVITASPEYYKWTQWLFLKFFEKGLAYQSETPVNWCPGCKTVLANEQVVAGECERCGSTVEKRNMLQWNLKITDYADRLINDIEALDWPKPIKDAQKKLISQEAIRVFTTRPDTIFGATYLVLAPEHKLVEELKSQISNWDEVIKYVGVTKNKKDIDRSAEGKEKTGVELKGLKAINPANQEEIPIWIADYVLPHYGTGAIMAVPADDKRDEEFAQKFNLPIIKDYKVAGFEDFGTKKTTFKLRDWIISRQRYWGCPIPVIHCEKCGAVAVSEKDLPVVLPEVEDYLPSDDGKSPLSKVSAWANVKCPKCGADAKRETDTLDTFIDSSWYFLRYTDPKNEKEFASKEKLKQWMPVNFYSGGAEHTNMHLLYSRFFHKVLFDLDLVRESEPFIRRMNRGLILGPDGHKMSKSKGNVVDPDDYVERLGADTVRTYLAFIGPYNEVGSYPWNPDSIVGIRRFLERVWNVSQTKIGAGSMDEKLIHQSIKNITESLERLKMNTAVPTLMTFINVAEKSGLTKEQFEIYLKLLAPFAPHVAEELWYNLGHTESIHLESWPKFDSDKLTSGEVTMGVQVNGKHRANITVSTEASEEEVKKKVLELPEIKKWLDGAAPKRIIVVLAKIVNIVV